jgi:amino acid adenylation domain-containing protein
MIQLLNKISENFYKYNELNAFFINDTYYSYQYLSNRVSAIQQALIDKNIKVDNIGVLTYDDIDTYASILAILFSGYGFVPINPNHPITRNQSIIENSQLQLILSSRAGYMIENQVDICITNSIASIKNEVKITPRDNDSNAYLIFTSGTTGLPKGVVISYGNINAFLEAYFSEFHDLGCEDRFLQMFDLTFDASIMHYLPALYVGGCTYTMPEGKVKYLYAYKILSSYNITFSLLMPSTLSYLKPYFGSMNLPNLKYSLFGGEAVIYNLVEEWAKCVPNAKIYNAYGPTEASIFFLLYEWEKDKVYKKTHNGLMPIGKPIGNSIVILWDIKTSKPISELNTQGELCIAGSQLTVNGYVGANEKNISQFFSYEIENQLHRFYKTGDIAILNENNDFVYCGRIDEQVQIDGHRVELSEIEYFARIVTNCKTVVAIALLNDVGTQEIALFFENPVENKNEIKSMLKNHIPKYMIPEKIYFLDEIPLTANNKFDKAKLTEIAI